MTKHNSLTNKTDLVNMISQETNLTQKDILLAVNAFMKSVINSLKSGGEVRLVGFGTFRVNKSPARKGRNPRTGEELDIPAQNRPTFRVGQEFKDAVNDKDASEKDKKPEQSKSSPKKIDTKKKK